MIWLAPIFKLVISRSILSVAVMSPRCIRQVYYIKIQVFRYLQLAHSILWSGNQLTNSLTHFALSYTFSLVVQSSVISHQSSVISHQSSVISHQSSVISHQSSVISHQSSVISHGLMYCIVLHNICSSVLSSPLVSKLYLCCIYVGLCLCLNNIIKQGTLEYVVT